MRRYSSQKSELLLRHETPQGDERLPGVMTSVGPLSALQRRSTTARRRVDVVSVRPRPRRPQIPVRRVFALAGHANATLARPTGRVAAARSLGSNARCYPVDATRQRSDPRRAESVLRDQDAARRENGSCVRRGSSMHAPTANRSDPNHQLTAVPLCKRSRRPRLACAFERKQVRAALLNLPEREA
jgi:hypothetical protein